MNKVIITHSSEETEKIGIELALSLRDGMVVSLVGEVGTGKTTLVKGIGKGLLINCEITSPSYLLAKEYYGQLVLHHLDAYRIYSMTELREVGLDELLPPAEGVTVVEWADHIAEMDELSDISVTITYLDFENRKVTINTKK
ncbi:tRNA (adenosine(37)-N6)-threonylcarbamoyltransferase complex ATPase subunit type 1 TsaE [Candidatus Acetothermia bacterium]|jgi:tRNA threonylcarbamoyladenosine biosynthesis protein TsaE|nr:tRNA (adenosine(37)-N6)-threonylcarbamoyltransferase complex ATPase subunit type 1 TsaE [Candidatus Acetothermia bacterium]MCI2427233.1 tRNA (adenosine(37)-N6)-threonylcarbamoyltransferase complex ATPase subunit type 1 TsaE [Candidatus Acetothermia bacterium]MCI2428742.1 tRNA (adenosine(37)-N6)-threonylcarbamoyltransferase complex ATPase subunit type 1 TsaE [Candidatus Acetothermia bacterium]